MPNIFYNPQEQEQAEHDSGLNDDLHNIMREEARDICQEIQDAAEAAECEAFKAAFIGPPTPPTPPAIQAELDSDNSIPF